MNNNNILGNNNSPQHSNINIIGNSIASLANNSTYINNIRSYDSGNTLTYDPSTTEITYITRFNVQRNTHTAIDISDNNYSFTSPLENMEKIDGGYIYSGTLLTANRTIYIPVAGIFQFYYPRDYTCTFTILSAQSDLDNFNFLLDITAPVFSTNNNITIYIDKVLITTFPHTLTRTTPYICEIESREAPQISGGYFLVYHFRSLR
jgi:hypothetical protein